MKRRESSKLYWILGFVAVVLIASVGLILLGFSSWRKSEPAKAVEEQTDIGGNQATETRPPEGRTDVLLSQESSDAPAHLAAPAPSSPEAESEKISQILLDPNADFAGIVDNLLNALPEFSLDSQVEAAHHIVNLSEDPSVSKWSQKLIENQFPPEVADVFFNDLLNRSHDLSMPILARIADNAGHAKAQEARDILEILYGAPETNESWQMRVMKELAAQQAVQ